VSPAAGAALVPDVRAAIGQGDLAGAEALVAKFRAHSGNTPEALEALSWLGRGALAAKDYAKAARYAQETRELVLDALKSVRLDAEPHLAVALGAAIETDAMSLAATGQRASAILALQDALKRYRDTPIRPRIQKNIHLLSLEGKPAPAFTATEFLGSPMRALKGHPTLLFFWAHWCPDCKAEAPIIADLARSYGPAGLRVVGPTRRYGYVAGRASATPAEEFRYIEQVRQQYYGAIADMAVPVSDEDCLAYGMDATPTLVLVDRRGIVTLYHPGRMTRVELEPYIKAITGTGDRGQSR
jgi:cytochrome c biogenesis protein CcmG/thiol:disulfide interchange protein DsbE